MLTSCINHPPKHPLIIIREWQVNFCEGDKCAAALMSFLEYWHNIKSEQAWKASQANDVAEYHGDQRNQDESLIQFHTAEELKDGIMGLYSDKKIRAALQFLEEEGVITIMTNPNPRYAFDQTKHFIFHPEVCNKFIEASYKATSFQSGKMPHPFGENARRVGENARRVGENARRENGVQSDDDNLEAIVDNSQTTTETTTEKTQKISPEISASPPESEKEGSKPTLTTPVRSRATPGESDASGKDDVSDKLYFTRAVATFFNHLRETYPDKISQGLTVPRRESTLAKYDGKNQYTTILKWYEVGKTVEEVCHALTAWTEKLKKPVSSINYFEKAVFPPPEKPKKKLNDEDRRSQMQALRQQLEASDE